MAFYWWISGLAVVLGTIGTLILMRALSKSSGKLRRSLVYFVVTLTSYMAYNILATVLVYRGVQPSSPLWLVFIAIHLTPGFAWLMTNKIMSEIVRGE